MKPTPITSKKLKQQTNRTAVLLTPLEGYARTAAGLEMCALLARWYADAPNDRTLPFLELAGAVCSRLNLNYMLSLYLPHEESLKTGLITQSKTNPGCFSEALTKLLNAREELVVPLLLATHVDQFSEVTGASVESYQEAVQVFLNLLNSIFLTGFCPSQLSGDLRSLIWSVPEQASAVAKTVSMLTSLKEDKDELSIHN